MPLFIAAASSWPTWVSDAAAGSGRFQARVETDSPPLMERAISVLYRTAAIAEAVTWAGLLVGMLFKYVIDGNDLGVRVFGRLHGAAFVAYVPITLLAALRFRWSPGVTALGVLAAFPPLCTVFFDRWAARTGRLAPPREAPIAVEP